MPSEVRWACAARACYGVALLCVPGRLIAAATGHAASGRTCAVARVLGVRHLVQAAICGLIPARALVAAGTTADGLHVASMLALSGVVPDVRRAVLADVAAETALASAGALALRR